MAGAGLLLALAVVLTVLPPPPPEVRLFSDGWGASSFVEGEACAPGEAPAATSVLPKPPLQASPTDRIALAARYLAWGLLLPVLLPMVLLSRTAMHRHAVATHVFLFGLAPAYFQWGANPGFVSLRQAMAEFWLARWPMEAGQEAWLDAAALGAWMLGGLAVGLGSWRLLAAASCRGALPGGPASVVVLPVGVAMLTLGLTEPTAAYLRGEGVNMAVLPWLRALMLAVAVLACVALAARCIRQVPCRARRGLLSAAWMLPVALGLAHGWAMYFHWVDRYRV
ncbi:hypothetical protein CKO37_01810 [Rubrivivax gelatinosus]|nr:hypothetical protein [Rubrivivax gelatinosus]